MVSTPIKSPTADPGPATMISGPEEKPRLTEEEKKQNHIASEQKRRQAIREGFDRLTVLVPGLEGQGRSEGLVLKTTVDFMRKLLLERKKLIKIIEENGGQLPEDLAIPAHDDDIGIKSEAHTSQGLHRS